jgi:hypothetical protein
MIMISLNEFSWIVFIGMFLCLPTVERIIRK